MAASTYRQIDLVLDEPCYSLLFPSIARVSLCTFTKINGHGIARSSGRVGPGNFEKRMISFVSQSRNRVMELVYSSATCHVNCLAIQCSRKYHLHACVDCLIAFFNVLFYCLRRKHICLFISFFRN